MLQVIDWIENHGEAFLSKHTGVGKSLHRARALQKRHDDFEEVAQVRHQPHLIRFIQTRSSQGTHPLPVQTNTHHSYLNHLFSDRDIQIDQLKNNQMNSFSGNVFSTSIRLSTGLKKDLQKGPLSVCTEII